MERIGGPASRCSSARSRSPEHAAPHIILKPSTYKKIKNKALVTLNTGGFHVCATVGFRYNQFSI